jgi:hypothetical protein
MMRAAFGAALAASLVMGACKPGVGDNCVCEGECRAGLVCARGGAVLLPGECVASQTKTDPGRCIEAENLPEGTSSIGEPPDKHDVGSKRDFQPGTPQSSGGESSGASSSSSSSSGSSTSSSSSSSSGSSSSGSSSSSTTSGSSSGAP